MTTKSEVNYKDVLNKLNITDAKKARAYLLFTYDKEGKEATTILSKAGFSTRTKGEGVGFNEVVEYLAEEPRTKADLYDFITTKGTGNEARWVSQRDTIRVVINKVFAKAKKTVVEVEPTDAEVEALKAKIPASKAKK